MAENENRFSIAPHAGSEDLSDDYKIKLCGKEVPVYRCRVSAVPMNQVWPGYQRPISQTEIASFATVSFQGTVTVEIEVPNKQIQKVEIRPEAYHIKYKLNENQLCFELSEARHFTVEVNGHHHALHLFCNPIQSYQIESMQNQPRFFGRGVHYAGDIRMKSGDTVVIDDGAVVYGSIYAENADDISILGHGILDGSLYPSIRESKYSYNFKQGLTGCICLNGCNHVLIDGIICRDPNLWTVTLNYCVNVVVSNIKLIGLWRYNSDGIDICNSRNVHVKNCFLRTYDDGIVIKGMQWCYNEGAGSNSMNVENILVENCVLWCDWGRALELGVETYANEMKNIRFFGCHIIRSSFISLDICCGHYAVVSNVMFEDITVQNDDHNARPVFQKEEGQVYYDDPDGEFVPSLMVCTVEKWSGDNPSEASERGRLRDVVFKNISCRSKHFPPSVIKGADAQHKAENIQFDNIVINKKRMLSAEQLQLEVNEFVDNVTVY